MKAIEYNTMIVGYKVSNVDLTLKQCDVTVYGKLSQEPVEIKDVYISGLLVSRMTSEKSMAHYQPDKKYSCVNNETYRKLNPFQLIRYKRDGEIRYYLTVVEDAGSKVIQRGLDMFGQPMEQRVFLPWYKAKQYRRFRNLVKVEETEKQPA